MGIAAENKMTQLSSKVDINSTLPNKLLTELSPELNLNSTLPPELLTNIFHFLPFADLKNALLVCRSTKNKIS